MRHFLMKSFLAASAVLAMSGVAVAEPARAISPSVDFGFRAIVADANAEFRETAVLTNRVADPSSQAVVSKGVDFICAKFPAGRDTQICWRQELGGKALSAAVRDRTPLDQLIAAPPDGPPPLRRLAVLPRTLAGDVA